jgi:hypothetical protein
MKTLKATIVLFATVAVLTGTISQGQNSDRAVSAAKMMPAEADPDWDIVAVKESPSSAHSSTLDVRGRYVIVTNKTVEEMLRVALGLQASQVVGGPNWIRTQHFDVDGVPNVEGQPNIKQLRNMLWKLLEEQFGLGNLCVGA